VRRVSLPRGAPRRPRAGAHAAARWRVAAATRRGRGRDDGGAL